MRQVYDFRPAFAAVKPHLSAADITVANLETILDDSRPYRGYPRFNSPAALAKALQDAGVNIVITANNHALDQGERGVLSTLANLKDAGLLAIGTYAQEEDRAPLILTVKGFKLAFLAYTTTTNGLPLPKGKDYLVNLWQAEQAAADIAAARAEGAEFVVVSLHFGQEYQRQPSKEQEEVVQQLVTAGADLILGSHPHVVQPIVEIEKPSGDGRVLVAYSLGNFISNQKDPYTDQGLILYATLRRHPLTGRVGLASYWELPTRVLRGKEIKVVPADITES
ncbi:MAG: CapA family protein [Firmicutes bacterium]|nr:CapA family protein [Bacillota bacterium]